MWRFVLWLFGGMVLARIGSASLVQMSSSQRSFQASVASFERCVEVFDRGEGASSDCLA
jgi:hypothetical protein